MKKIILLSLVLIFSNSAFAISCHGTEPFWSAEITETEVTVQFAGEKKQTYAVEKTEGAMGFTAEYLTSYYSQKGPLAVVKSANCNDGMSDFEFGKETLIFIPSGTMSGCCGDPL